jgi:hypothetical protein
LPVTLPSGLSLLLAGDAPFDPGQNWFECPPGHFWIKVAAPEMGEPLFDLREQVWDAFEHAPVPRNRKEAAKYARVYEMLSDGTAAWRGEWLHNFPKYRNLTTGDLSAWEKWVNGPDVGQCLDEIIELCAQFAERSREATGYFLAQGPEIREVPALSRKRGEVDQ